MIASILISAECGDLGTVACVSAARPIPAANAADGLGVIAELRRTLRRDVPAGLLTSDAVKHAVREYGCMVPTKPVKRASLRAF